MPVDAASQKMLDAMRAAEAPPAMVILAEDDILRDEGQAYADRSAGAGVPVSTRLIEGQMHGFLAQVHLLPGASALSKTWPPS